jgi:hypothetical protein
MGQQVSTGPIVPSYCETRGFPDPFARLGGHRPTDRMRHLCVELLAYNASDIVLTEDRRGNVHINSRNGKLLKWPRTRKAERSDGGQIEVANGDA